MLTGEGESRNSEFGIPTSKFHCVIAGGGTGGHLFPGIAVAKELDNRFENAEILFVIGRERKESNILSNYGYQARSIDVEGLKGRGWKKVVSVLFKLPKSIWQSASVINEFSPDLVLGMGGYSSGPMCLAAKFLGIPTAIHEQNSYPGLTNRLLSRLVDRVFISLEESRMHFRGGSVFLTGNPVREELFSDRRVERKEGDRFTILVVGGSQGARAINEAVAESLLYLNRKGKNPEVIHQTGDKDYIRVKDDYRARGTKVEVTPFIQDMTKAYKRADIVVSRAGATTIFELAALGKPSVLIPYPYAANQHQEINARSLVRAGGAEMILQKDLTGERLARLLAGYMDERSALKRMGEQARKMGRRDAAKIIVDQLMDVVKRTNRRSLNPFSATGN